MNHLSDFNNKIGESNRQYQDTGLDIDDVLNLRAFMRGEVEYSFGEGIGAN